MKAITLITASALTLAASAQTPVYLDESAPIADRVADALSRMTLEEKVALSHAQSKFTSPGVPRLGIPELHLSDGPHGVRAEVSWNDWGYAGWTNDSVTAFPALTALAATWNPSLAASYGKAVGEEALYRDKHVMLGPGLNICRTPLCGRNFEYLGEDPYLTGELAVPYIQAMQGQGVAACVKHFAVNNQETWRDNVDVVLSDRALYEIYLPAFRRAVQDGGAWSIMGAYNQIWGEHCCHNSRLLNDILRGEWGFDGCVITDWGGAHDTRQAALNGLDLEMGTYTDGLQSDNSLGYEYYYLANPYLDLIRKGEVPMEVVDEKAGHVLTLIFRTAMNRNKPWGSMCTPEHYATAKAIGDESIILLKNNGLLPLLPGKAGRVLVVGDNATRRLTDGGGSSELKPKDYITPLDAIRAKYGAENVAYAPGYMAGPPVWGRDMPVPRARLDSMRAEAVAMAKDADVVIYIGGLNKNATQDCEGVDRVKYSLSYDQNTLIDELLDANPNVVIANISGCAYEMPWIDRAPAVMHISYLGTMGGASIADAISGDVNPSGKLPYSIPVRLTDCGAHASGQETCFPGVENAVPDINRGMAPQVEYQEDILVGYRWHDTKKIPALFPFGHGLSYTNFKYGKLALSAKSLDADGTLTVTIPVTNVGPMAGKETVQLYIGDDKCSVLRPVKELKGFDKVALAPGQTAEVKFTITPDDLKFYDPTISQWIAEPGKFTIYIGSSSADIRAKASFTYAN